MLNRLWVGFFLVAAVAAFSRWGFGHDPSVFQAMVSSLFEMAKLSVDVILTLFGTITLWLGILKIAEEAGLSVPGDVSVSGFDGVRVDGLAPYERVHRGVGYVPQGREIFGRLSVLDNLRMGLASLPARTAVPEELFELFPVLSQMKHRRGGDLSGGQQQQLAIARALAPGPRLLLLDESTEGIQPSVIKEIGRVIRRLAERRTMAIVLVEQYYDFAAELADRYVVMERGAVIARGAGSAMAADGVRALMAV